ncbi:MAG TPA: ATP-binding protein [Ramlibacter sp.]|nr:ATP-binding protein [Ramlibacter sp.]
MHILTRGGPMCSLRRALLAWLVPLFLLVGGASGGIAYWSYTRMVGQFMDEQMQQLAEAIAANDERVTQRPQDAGSVHQWGSYVTQVWTRGGQLESTTWADAGLPLARAAGFHDVTAGGRDWRVYATDTTPSGRRVQVLQSSEFRRKLAAGRAGGALLPVLILLPLAIAILWAVVAKLSREVQDIGRQAARQDEHTIAELPLTRVPGEIVPLVASFNTLLARLRDAFATQRRFVQDAAHELRTPITAVALQLQNVRHDLPPGACKDSFAQLEAGVGRAQRLVDQLLKLSRQENAAAVEQPVAVDLQAQVRDCINGLIALADRRGIDLGFVAAPGAASSALVTCQPADIRSVLDNLVENALRYTPRGGVVDVHLSAQDGQPVIEVVDTGPGIPEEQLPRVFDRFFRVPGTGAEGSGLGLSIAQGAAQRCGLRISLRNRTDRQGLVARVEALERR